MGCLAARSGNWRETARASEVQGGLGGDAEDGGLPIHRLGASSTADNTASEVAVALGLHVPITGAETKAEVGVDLVVEHGLQLITPAKAVLGNRSGKAAGATANPQQMRIGSLEKDIRQCNRLAAQPPISHAGLAVYAKA